MTDYPDRLDDAKAEHIRRILERTGGNISEAARRLGISRSTLQRWMPRRPRSMPPSPPPPPAVVLPPVVLPTPQPEPPPMPKNVKISRKKKGTQPYLPPPKARGSKKAPPPALVAQREARRRILDRTAAARARLAAEAEGADMSDVDHLPVATNTYKPSRRRFLGTMSEQVDDATSPEPRPRPPMAPPVAFAHHQQFESDIDRLLAQDPPREPIPRHVKWADAVARANGTTSR